MKLKENLIGAHISIVGGFHKAIDKAESIGANCIQIFTKSNRQWKSKNISLENINALNDRIKTSHVIIVAAHASYLINLGSKNLEIVSKSIQALASELERCEILNIPYLVFHPGTARFDDEKKSLQYIAQGINQALKLSKTKKVTLLVETMAGQGNSTGSTFNDLELILKFIKQKKRIGVCFDTCHAFASGYEFDTTLKYKKMWKDFDKKIGLKNLKLFHINDSKKEKGSRLDRHENLGEGKINPNAFKLLIQDKNFINIPKIIETPKKNDFDDKKNITFLKNYIKQKK